MIMMHHYAFAAIQNGTIQLKAMEWPTARRNAADIMEGYTTDSSEDVVEYILIF